MLETIVSLCAGAVAQVAGAITIESAAAGIVGNRADAVFRQSCTALLAGIGKFTASRQPTELARSFTTSIATAYRHSLRYHLETLSSQVRNASERALVDDLNHAVATGIDAAVTLDSDEMHAAISPLLARLGDESDWEQAAIQATVNAVSGWCETALARPLPLHLAMLFRQRAPNGRRSWLEVFRDELGTLILKDPSFERLFLASNISKLVEHVVTIDAVAQALQADVQETNRAIIAVGEKVDSVALYQAEQINHLRRLEALLATWSGASSPEALNRVLNGVMFTWDGTVRPTALILVSAFGCYSAIDLIGRTERLALIRDIQARLLEAVDADVHVGRFDAGEFDLIVRDITSRSRIEALAAEVLDALREPFFVNGSPLVLKPVAGVAMSPWDSCTAEALQRKADLALRAAISDSSDVAIFYRTALDAGAKDRRRLEAGLRRALTDESLYLVYQPIVNVATEAVVSFEALLRWQHPEYGAVSPATFIPMAEDMGLIPEIGNWVIRKACADAAGWADYAGVSVNVSPIQFADPRFTRTVETALASTPNMRGRLELEVPEGIFLRNDVAADAVLARFRELGIRMALDDFGTGYSSLGYLSRGQFDTIKIDRSFIRSTLANDAKRKQVVGAIVALAQGLGMATTAEGIETREEFEVIRELGCDYAQGFLFGRSLRADAVLGHILDPR
ncbi:MAG: GGDEF domain-containing phosphodiesterase [Pseudomonadota bacterium]